MSFAPSDTVLAMRERLERFCRIADGPDEVHMSQLGRWTQRDARGVR